MLGNVIYRITPDRMAEFYAASPDWLGLSGLSADGVGNVYALVSTTRFEQASLVVKIAPDRSITRLARIYANAIAGDDAGNQYLADYSC